MQVIRRNDADFVLAGGFDSMINPVGLSSFCLLGALSTYNETPETASRPFDGTRNGFVLGEGAAFLILEEWEKARARGARVIAITDSRTSPIAQSARAVLVVQEHTTLGFRALSSTMGLAQSLFIALAYALELSHAGTAP